MSERKYKQLELERGMIGFNKCKRDEQGWPYGWRTWPVEIRIWADIAPIDDE